MMLSLCGLCTGRSVAWKVKMLQVGDWAYAGVVSNTSVPEKSYEAATAYGWGPGSWVVQAGKFSGATDGWNGWVNGIEAIFRLDMEASRLLMKLVRTNTTYALDLPRDVPQWHVHIHLYYANSTIAVEPVAPDDALP
jgi:hypothetical protein